MGCGGTCFLRCEHFQGRRNSGGMETPFLAELGGGNPWAALGRSCSSPSTPSTLRHTAPASDQRLAGRRVDVDAAFTRHVVTEDP